MYLGTWALGIPAMVLHGAELHGKAHGFHGTCIEISGRTIFNLEFDYVQELGRGSMV